MPVPNDDPVREALLSASDDWPLGLAIVGAGGEVQFVNAEMIRMLGATPRGWADLPGRGDGPEVVLGAGVRARWAVTPLSDRWLVQAQDITSQRELEAQLADAGERLRTIAALHRDLEQAEFDMDEVMVWILDRARRLIGATAASVGIVEHDEIVYRYRASAGENPHDFIRSPRSASLSGICTSTGETVHCTDSEEDPRVDLAACRAQGLRSMIIVPLRYRGTVVGVLNVNSPEPDAFGPSDIQTLELIAGAISAAYAHAVDLAAKRSLLDELGATVGALRESEAKLARQALHDPLTELPNRTLFHDRLRAAQARRKTPDEGVAVLFVDLDGFKAVNDTHGHEAGDTLLVAAAGRIRGLLRGGDTIARLGGDEFLILLEGEGPETLAVNAARRILDALAEPFPVPGGVVHVAASIGIASGSGSDDGLVSQADAAMYRAKAGGRGRYEIHRPSPVRRARAA